MAKKATAADLDAQIKSIADDIPVDEAHPDLPESLKHRNEVLQKRRAIAERKAKG